MGRAYTTESRVSNQSNVLSKNSSWTKSKNSTQKVKFDDPNATPVIEEEDYSGSSSERVSKKSV